MVRQKLSAIIIFLKSYRLPYFWRTIFSRLVSENSCFKDRLCSSIVRAFIPSSHIPARRVLLFIMSFKQKDGKCPICEVQLVVYCDRIPGVEGLAKIYCNGRAQHRFIHCKQHDTLNHVNICAKYKTGPLRGVVDICPLLRPSIKKDQKCYCLPLQPMHFVSHKTCAVNRVWWTPATAYFLRLNVCRYNIIPSGGDQRKPWVHFRRT